jgi:hypothetical protein
MSKVPVGGRAIAAEYNIGETMMRLGISGRATGSGKQGAHEIPAGGNSGACM